MNSWRAVRAGLAAVAVVVLAACARPVGVEPAPSASEPVCAEVLLALPEALGGQERRSTTSQASAAWGEDAIVLRCGVEPPGPTVEGCVGVVSGSGVEVDWIVTQTGTATSFTTYGRLPAVEVTVPAAYAGDQTIVADLSAVVADLPRDGDRECL